MSNKTCFVVMPIRKPGTPEHAHFRAVYNNIKPVAEKAGFTVERVDDVQKSGPITRDIVMRLGESDLVIADMTDLNPNVFYELGIRHALRGIGTVMILDEKRTPEIPFDLSAYRVIKFTGDLTGIDSLTQALVQFMEEDESADPTHRDNPVHVWFPMLPTNVLDSSSDSSAAPLRKTIKQLQERLSSYEKAYGSDPPGSKSTTTPLSTVLAALADAEDGHLPSNIMDAARRAFETRDAVAFLQTIRIVLERNIRIPPTMFIALASWANVMDMDDIVKALFDQALQFYPSNGNLRQNYLVTLAHSDAPGDRERARQEIAQELSVDISKDELEEVDAERIQNDLGLILMVLDTYQRDKLYQQELALAKKLFAVLPDSADVVRSYARALGNNDQPVECLKYHRESLFCPDVDDTSAIWFGNELHNRRRNRDAAEAYAFGCLLDPADAKNYAHLAEELAVVIDRQSRPFGKKDEGDGQIKNISPVVIGTLARCSASCQNIDAEAAERLRRALGRLEIHSAEDANTPIARAERIECIRELYSLLQTSLTTAGSAHDFTAQQEDPGDKQ